VLVTLPVTKESLAGPQKLDLDLDPRFFIDYNKLHLQLIGHYTNDCEFPLHSSLWASISNMSKLELNLQPIALRNDLALLPAPFFDQRDNRLLNLPFVFAAKPSLDSLRAAGGLASWFGALASYRGTRFPTYLNRLPERYGVVFATNDERPEFLAKYPNVDAPTISLMQHPENPTGKLLLILGRNSADLQLAADALALGKAAMTGTSTTVKTLEYPARRVAYDAPNWLQWANSSTAPPIYSARVRDRARPSNPFSSTPACQPIYLPGKLRECRLTSNTVTHHQQNKVMPA
jgi:hypothetical protein